MVVGWGATGGVEGAGTGLAPLAGTGEASGTGFRGTLVS